MYAKSIDRFQKEIVERSIKKYFYDEFLDPPISAEEQKKLHEHYRKILNTKLNSKKFNDMVLNKFYDDYNKTNESESIERIKLDKSLKVLRKGKSNHDHNSTQE